MYTEKCHIMHINIGYLRVFLFVYVLKNIISVFCPSMLMFVNSEKINWQKGERAACKSHQYLAFMQQLANHASIRVIKETAPWKHHLKNPASHSLAIF